MGIAIDSGTLPEGMTGSAILAQHLEHCLTTLANRVANIHLLAALANSIG